jgi:erythromycin esterase-like protein
MGFDAEYAPLLDLIGDSRFVLIGEASHGTTSFTICVHPLTRRLIEEKGFTAVAAEADWPDAHRVNRYVLGRGADQHAVQALDNDFPPGCGATATFSNS